MANNVHVSATSMVLNTPCTQQSSKRIIPCSSPPIHSSDTAPRSRSIHNAARRRIQGQNSFRVRRTRVVDLDVISTMLARESVPWIQHTHNQWNVDMQRLRAKYELRRQLSHRLAALDEGREIANTVEERYALQRPDDGTHNDDVCSLTDEYDTCHQLWQSDNFRSKVRMAVAHSHENTAWKVHNFNLVPSAELLNHVMMSVVHLSSGVVVGFCEVAWLPCPRRREGAAQYYAPAIINLVTSPSHRRMGIASRLIKFASKFTATQWKRRTREDNDLTGLGLYVHLENESAMRLYKKQGFSQISYDAVDGLLYMSQIV